MRYIINRIGTNADKIYIYNFYPTSRVDDDIELQKKAIVKLQAFHSALGEDSQIYSPDEEVDTFGLFDRSFEEERDERLAYLMKLREYKKLNEKEFRLIRNKPLRTRLGRKDKDLKGDTICFIRNQRRDVFYQIKNDNSIEELSFVQTAQYFEANQEEKSVPLHDKHHDHVNIAIDDFNEKLKLEAAELQAVNTNQGPTERSALKFLDACSRLDFASKEEQDKIKGAQHSIKLGQFQQLQRDINRLRKSLKNNNANPTLRPTSSICLELRSYKDDVELALLQHAIDIGDQAFEETAAQLRVGMSEKEAAWIFEQAVLLMPLVQNKSFTPIGKPSSKPALPAAMRLSDSAAIVSA